MTHDQDILSEAASLLSLADDHADGSEQSKLRWVLAIGFVTIGRIVGAILADRQVAREPITPYQVATKGKSK